MARPPFRWPRAHLARVLEALILAIEIAGGEAALKDLAASISDAARWWP